MTPDSSNLLATMQKCIRQMKAKTGLHGTPIHKAAMGKDALADLRRRCGPTVPAQPGDGLLSGIQIMESEILEPDQWIAYDRDGKVVAIGRGDTVKILAAALPFPSP